MKKQTCKKILLISAMLLAFNLKNVFSQEVQEETSLKTESASPESVSETEAPSVEDSETDEKKSSNFFVRTFNTIANLPFGYDLGCEPTENGSLTYFGLNYRWAEDGRYFSAVDFTYGTLLKLKNDAISMDRKLDKYEDKTTRVNLKLVPFGFKFFGKENKDFYFSIKPGLGYSFTNENVVFSRSVISDSGITYVNLDETLKNHYIKPYVEFELEIPVTSFFSINCDQYVSPVYMYWMNFKMDMYAATSRANEGSFSVSDFKVNYGVCDLEAQILLKFFKFVALSTKVMYLRINTNKLNYSIENRDPDFVFMDNLDIKVGASLINIGKSNLRLKTGVFYQWQMIHYDDSDKWDCQGRWIFGVGMKNLY